METASNPKDHTLFIAIAISVLIVIMTDIVAFSDNHDATREFLMTGRRSHAAGKLTDDNSNSLKQGELLAERETNQKSDNSSELIKAHKIVTKLKDKGKHDKNGNKEGSWYWLKKFIAWLIKLIKGA